MRWLPHLGLLALMASMLVVARVKHLPTDEAIQIAFDHDAPTDDRLWAMHVAANRATESDPRLGDALVREFLGASDERLVEAAVLIDLCRHAQRPPGAPAGAGPPLQDAYTYGRLPAEGWTAHRFRTLMLHRRKVGGSQVGGVRRMDLTEATWFIDTLRGGPLPPTAEVQAYLTYRAQAPAAYQPKRTSAPR